MHLEFDSEKALCWLAPALTNLASLLLCIDKKRIVDCIDAKIDVASRDSTNLPTINK